MEIIKYDTQNRMAVSHDRLKSLIINIIHTHYLNVININKKMHSLHCA